MTKKARDMNSDMVEPMAAPLMPSAGNPSLPKMSIQLRHTFDSIITKELMDSTLVWVVPM